MRRRAVLAALLAAVPAAHAADDPLLARVRARLADAAVLQGAFEQRKSVKGFRQPLVSKGDFLVAKGRGVVWSTREPVPSTLVVTRDRLLVRAADGTAADTVDATKEPGIRAVNEMLFALMAGDLAALAARFDVTGELVGADGWRLALVPRDAGLARWVSRVTLEGDRFVRRVRLAEASGDAADLVLSRHATAPALTPSDAARFD